MEQEPAERTTRDIREHLADVVNAAVRGQVTYVTSNGRRVAAVVPLAVADAALTATTAPPGQAGPEVPPSVPAG